MATRQEIALSKTAEIQDGEIVFRAATRNPAANWIWLDLLRAGDDEGLTSVAGRVGPIGPPNIRAADDVEAWRQLQNECARILRGLLGDRREVFSEMGAETSGALWAVYMASDPWRSEELEHLGTLVERHIVEGSIGLESTLPLRTRGITTAGMVISKAFQEAFSARHILECQWCRRLFTLDSIRPKAWCSGACRKAAFVANQEEG